MCSLRLLKDKPNFDIPHQSRRSNVGYLPSIVVSQQSARVIAESTAPMFVGFRTFRQQRKCLASIAIASVAFSRCDSKLNCGSLISSQSERTPQAPMPWKRHLFSCHLRLVAPIATYPGETPSNPIVIFGKTWHRADLTVSGLHGSTAASSGAVLCKQILQTVCRRCSEGYD